MRFYLISDNVDTQLGLRLAGIDGVVVHEPAAVERELGRAIADETVGVVLITEPLARQCGPLVVEIPDRHGSRTKDSITRYVRDAIGVKF